MLLVRRRAVGLEACDSARILRRVQVRAAKIERLGRFQSLLKQQKRVEHAVS